MKAKFIPPQFEIESFNCPHCGSFAYQHWSRDAYFHYKDGDGTLVYNESGFRVRASRCHHCKKLCMWFNGKMTFPDAAGVETPNEDLPLDVKADYMEAASVLQKSPRAAAALLRLALQKLCMHLGGKGKNIQQDIDLLVENGLPKGVLEAMDSVRIIGNEALHPGQIDIRDDAETAATLFRLINFAAEKTLTDPKQLQEFYATLPDSKKRNNRGKGE